jgi:hypothetical protein
LATRSSIDLHRADPELQPAQQLLAGDLKLRECRRDCRAQKPCLGEAVPSLVEFVWGRLLTGVFACLGPIDNGVCRRKEVITGDA